MNELLNNDSCCRLLYLQASAEPFLGAVRDCYEAYIVYTFMAMLIEVRGGIIQQSRAEQS
jgi:hypothetical protein